MLLYRRIIIYDLIWGEKPPANKLLSPLNLEQTQLLKSKPLNFLA